MNSSAVYLILLALTFLLTVLSLRFLIPKLKSLKMGQKILDIGPRWHKSKEGTPTMGGISFVAVSLLLVLTVFAVLALRGRLKDPLLLFVTFGMALLNGLVGCIDDYTKFIKKQNEGLKAYQKYFLQLLCAGLYLFILRAAGRITTALYIPYFGVELEMGIFYYVIALLVITGIVNSVNLTDGIDGLASSETAVVAAFFTLAGFVTANTDVSYFAALALGGSLGFLVYNFPPARVFMGDTGSLFLGGMAAGLAFLAGNPLIILIVGFMYVLESISVILQVFWVHVFGHRLFKMSPIHHHFERCGWSEIRIVAVFSLLTAVFCALGWFSLAR